jgi:large subunit ribosomal protein L10
LVRQYAEQLAQSQGLILTDYRGLRVPDMERLRHSIRETDSSFKVIKNRLLKLALDEAALETPDEWLEGPTAVAFCRGELPPVAKVINDFTEESSLAIKGGVMHDALLSVDEIVALASLPARDVLLAQMLSTFNAPATQVAGAVASGVRQVLGVLQAYVDKLEGGEPAPHPA